MHFSYWKINKPIIWNPYHITQVNLEVNKSNGWTNILTFLCKRYDKSIIEALSYCHMLVIYISSFKSRTPPSGHRPRLGQGPKGAALRKAAGKRTVWVLIFCCFFSWIWLIHDSTPVGQHFAFWHFYLEIWKPKSQELCFSGVKLLSDETVQRVIGRAPSLQVLDLTRCPKAGWRGPYIELSDTQWLSVVQVPAGMISWQYIFLIFS